MQEDTIKLLKKEFFARRNGVLADAMRRNGDPHAFIMGCMLSDIIEVTAQFAPNAELARALWADCAHRECRLAAPMLFPRDEMTDEEARCWALDVQTEEEADVLCHRLLRHLPCASPIALALIDNDAPLVAYTGWRLMANLLAVTADPLPPVLQTKAQAALSTPSTSVPLRDLLMRLTNNE